MSYKEGVIRECPHGTKVESSRFSDFDPKDWEGGRYASILDMVHRGCCNEEIMDRWPGVDESLCEVYRKVVDGTLADFGRLNDPYEVRGKGKCAERRRNMLMLAVAGMTDEEIAVETGFTVDTV